MMHIRSNIDNFLPDKTYDITEEEARNLTVEQFDALGLSEQIHLFHAFPSEYARLTGKSAEDTAPDISDGGSEAKVAIDEFESRWQAYMDAITAHHA